METAYFFSVSLGGKSKFYELVPLALLFFVLNNCYFCIRYCTLLHQGYAITVKPVYMIYLPLVL